MWLVVDRDAGAARPHRGGDLVRRGARFALVLAPVAAACFLLGRTTARANLPPSAISQMKVGLYGIYTSDDATCQSGLVATVPLTAAPSDFDFAASPSLGEGPIPAGGIKCVVILLESQLTMAWRAGSYTSTTRFGTSEHPDSNCNSGGTEGPLSFCDAKSPSFSNPTFPAAIQADLERAGLAAKAKCAADGDLTAIVPLYLSSDSKCVGVVEADNAIGGGCEWSLNTSVTPEGYRSNAFEVPPTGPDDTKHGIHIDPLPAGVSSFAFVVDPSAALGGNSSTGCGGIGPPRFSFRAAP
jgi:hypothetical protein